ncbi:MAG: protein-glutamate O-methyltransferase CheR [Deltaproteobacteria bacterium]|nr:protein-glutamate O-methyltransferase CheR [Nannocystaceae bacterium]
MVAAPHSSHVHTFIAALVEQRIGLHYREGERDLFVDKTTDHALERGYDSLLDYYYHLRYDADGSRELDLLIEALLVHETYLFRELRALTMVVDRIVMPVLERGRRPRIWSAACSTGEEPLSIAMLLAERGVLDRCELLATDVSEPSIVRARAARFRPRSLRGEGEELAQRWLERSGDHWVAPRRLVDAIDWSVLNLCDAEAVAALGRFDLVLCRHVLIYFGDNRVEEVIASLTQRLRERGALLVGISESLLRFSTELGCEEIDGVFVYRRQP